jgi:ubiquinone/menaquinone biosynthesis C-methylase UbiE
MTSSPDPVEMKRMQRDQWSLAASAWLRWFGVFERGAQTVNDALCDMAKLNPGQRVLDLASGLGEPSLTAARRVLPGGTVLGIDLAPQMVAFARERALERKITNAKFEEGDGEDLRVEPHSFDVALSRWGLMLMPDPPRAAANVRRALKPKALFAAAVWSTPDEVPFISVPQRVAMRELDLPPPDPDAPGPLRMGEAGALERCLEKAGFTDIESRVVPATIRFASIEELVSFQREMSGVLKRALESQPPEAHERVWKALARAAESFVEPDGSVCFENRCRLAVGRA